MNFYLAAVDEPLRHESDAPSIGMILCKGRNDVVVEYALLDAAKSIGVAGYQVSTGLPQRLEDDLPTSVKLARELPLMSLVHSRIDVERQLRKSRDSAWDTSSSRRCRAWVFFRSAPDRSKVLPSLHAVAHGIEVSRAEAEAATTACE